MSLPRRLELLNWAIEREAWILEDDYDGEYRYSGTPLMPLAALDQSNRVIYIGSFSKVMYPDYVWATWWHRHSWYHSSHYCARWLVVSRRSTISG